MDKQIAQESPMDCESLTCVTSNVLCESMIWNMLDKYIFVRSYEFVRAYVTLKQYESSSGKKAKNKGRVVHQYDSLYEQLIY